MPRELPLAGWETFYVIIGSAAAALTGLQFVVVALVADVRQRQRANDESNAISAFGAPTVVHFSAVLLMSAMLSAPWPALHWPVLLIGVLGAAGVGYSILVLSRALSQRGYRMVLEDWIWHLILPFVTYGGVVASSIALRSGYDGALFAVGAATLVLLFIGIHNAWDSVIYVAIDYAPPADHAKTDKPTV